MQLVQVRECDGACCVESPRFPNADHSDCIYHNPVTIGPENAGCKLMVDPSIDPDESKRMDDRMFDGITAEELFQSTCVEWPQSTPLKDQSIGKTGGCCWQWVEDGDRKIKS